MVIGTQAGSLIIVAQVHFIDSVQNSVDFQRAQRVIYSLLVDLTFPAFAACYSGG